MSISKVDKGYLVDVRPSGRNGRRYRKTFPTKAEAQKYEKFVLSQHHNKEWLDAPVDRRSLAELIELWFHYHGKTLKEGVKTRQKLLKTSDLMSNPKSYQLTKKSFLDYRSKRLNKVKPATVNMELKRLQGVYSVLIEAGEFSGEHPLRNIDLVKQAPLDLAFLSMSQIDSLLGILNGDILHIVQICLSTGARWSEAQNLTSSQVLNDRINFINTKNGKNRTVPISPSLRASLPERTGRLFDDCYSEFLGILKLSDIDLPKGQASHVLRHTFASHFVMNGGNILALQKILGHSNILMTMRYAHLAPEHLIEAIKLNPLAIRDLA